MLITAQDGRSEWRFSPQALDSDGSDDSDDSDGSGARIERGPAANTKDFVIHQTSKSGLGVFAARAIKQGERILAEAPLVQWTASSGATTFDGLISLVNALSPFDRQSFYSLCQDTMHGAVKSVSGIWLSNSYPSSTPAQAVQDRLRAHATRAIFVTASRFNHACAPCAHCAWNPRIMRQTIHALRDIALGTEITVNYLSDASGLCKDERHAQLGFSCACATCTSRLLAQSDQRRTRIAELFGLIQSAVVSPQSGPRGLGVVLVKERLALLEEEGVHTSWDTSYAAWAYCCSVGDKAEARKWACRAAESARIGLGRDSDEFIKYSAYVGSEGTEAGAAAKSPKKKKDEEEGILVTHTYRTRKPQAGSGM